MKRISIAFTSLRSCKDLITYVIISRHEVMRSLYIRAEVIFRSCFRLPETESGEYLFVTNYKIAKCQQNELFYIYVKNMQKKGC